MRIPTTLSSERVERMDRVSLRTEYKYEYEIQLYATTTLQTVLLASRDLSILTTTLPVAFEDMSLSYALSESSSS